MSAGEIVWRALSAARDRLDHARIAWHAEPGPGDVTDEAERLAVPCPPRLTDVPRGAWVVAPPDDERDWAARLAAAADEVAAHRVPIFGRTYELGSPIDWNRDHVHGVSVPLRLASSIDYRDTGRAGDAKDLWEPNRHQHLVVLARAYRASGDERYARELIAQWSSWLEQSPFGRGMNWRSPLELGIRLINWTWAFDLIRDSESLTAPFCARVLTSIYQHLWDVTRKYSRGSSANNHLIGEAAGVYVACAYFDRLPQADRWREQACRILCREVEAQTHADGGTREQAVRYQLFVFQLLALAGLAGRERQEEFPARYWARLERMLEFLAGLVEGGPLPEIGDADDGYVLDLGRTAGDLKDALSLGAVLFVRSDFKHLAGAMTEPTRWLLGADSARRFDAVPAERSRRVSSRQFSDTGYYLLQYGHSGASDCISVVFDCGPLGFSSLAAHGHADALSVSVRAFGRAFLVDPGTYDYFSAPAWRDYFRGTRAHNTVTVDDLDQSVRLGPFMWGQRASARCLEWHPRPDGGCVRGEHDGYRRLPDPVTHRRTVDLDGTARTLTIQDELVMAGSHVICLAFHLAPDCDVEEGGDHTWYVTAGEHAARLQVDPRLSVRLRRGGDRPDGGWVSTRYQRREPAVVVEGTARVDGGALLQCRLTFDR